MRSSRRVFFCFFQSLPVVFLPLSYGHVEIAAVFAVIDPHGDNTDQRDGQQEQEKQLQIVVAMLIHDNSSSESEDSETEVLHGLHDAIGRAQLVLGNHEGGHGPKGGGEEAVGQAHAGDGDVGGDAGERHEEMTACTA